jgi:hypothetical protein
MRYGHDPLSKMRKKLHTECRPTSLHHVSVASSSHRCTATASAWWSRHKNPVAVTAIVTGERGQILQKVWQAHEYTSS